MSHKADNTQARSVWCFPLLHQWQRWIDIEQGPLVGRSNVTVGTYITQERRCNRCEKVQLRTVSSLT